MRSSNSSSDWNERDSPARARRYGAQWVMSRPSQVIEPAVSRLLPATQSMSVVLPAPFGPSRPTTSPGATCSVTSSRAVNPPNRWVSPDTARVRAGTGVRRAAGSGSGAPGRSPGIRSRNRLVSASSRSATPFWLRISTTSSSTPVAIGRYCCQLEVSSRAALTGASDEVRVTSPPEASSDPTIGPAR